MMKRLAILLLLTTIYGCSQYYHSNQAHKHAAKAISKGAQSLNFGSDTVTISNVRIDTISKVDTVGEFIYITNEIIKTVHDTVKVNVYKTIQAKSKVEVRKDAKVKISQAKQLTKQVKFVEKSKKSNNWIWYFVCFAIGVLVNFIFKKIKS